MVMAFSLHHETDMANPGEACLCTVRPPAARTKPGGSNGDLIKYLPSGCGDLPSLSSFSS